MFITVINELIRSSSELIMKKTRPTRKVAQFPYAPPIDIIKLKSKESIKSTTN